VGKYHHSNITIIAPFLASGEAFPVKYIPALDGLRAFAILLVIGCHCLPGRILAGGLIGVDVFFVLSGFLISSILLRELHETGDISLSNFYWRRSLRLFPALSVLIAFELIRAAFSPHRSEILEATLVGAAYLQNWNNVFAFAPGDYMGHTWSLATEEQFYILWPLALPLVFKRKPLAWIAAAIGAMVVARELAYHFGFTRQALDFSLGLRPVGLLIGCALAFLPIRSWRLPNVSGPILFAALMSIALIGERVYVSAPLIASLLTAGLIVYLQRSSALASALSWPPFVYVGKISYGLFLYHLPIFYLGETFKPATPFHLYAAGLICLTFAAAALSYEFVEKPFLRLKDRLGARSGAPTAVPVDEGGAGIPRLSYSPSSSR
jgi:peptidoglycan/LPS O-acetylase OafA/YrhL